MFHALLSLYQKNQRSFLIGFSIIRRAVAKAVPVGADKGACAPAANWWELAQGHSLPRGFGAVDSLNHHACRPHIQRCFDLRLHQAGYPDKRHCPGGLRRADQMGPLHLLPAAMLMVDTDQGKPGQGK